MRKIVRPLLASAFTAALVGAAAPLGAHAASPVISWAPRNTTAISAQPHQQIVVRQGQTVTYTAQFSSKMPLASVAVKRTLSSYAQKNGVQITVMSTSLGTATALAANTPASVTFSVSASYSAFEATYNADLHVNGSVNGAAVAHQPNDLDFSVRVIDMAPVISWSSNSVKGVNEGPHSTITVRQGHSMTRTGQFMSSIPLTNVAVKRTLRDYAASHGVTVTVLSTSLGSATTLAANTPVMVTFVVKAAATTRVATYHTDIHVDGSANGSAQTFLRNSLPLIVDVDHS